MLTFYDFNFKSAEIFPKSPRRDYRSVNYCCFSSLMNKRASSQSSIKHHLYNVHGFLRISLSRSVTVGLMSFAKVTLDFMTTSLFLLPFFLFSRWILTPLFTPLSRFYPQTLFSLSFPLSLFSIVPPSHQSPRTPGRAGGCRWPSEARFVLPARRSGWGGDSSYLRGVKGQSGRSEQTKIAISHKNAVLISRV